VTPTATLPARTAVPALQVGPHPISPPVVLAPMAGITNAPFRRLCRSFGGGLYVSEMITTRALVERDAETMRLIEFGPDESPRSLQLYGVDPAVVREAVTLLVAEDRADHIDLNFGCPVPKVTRRGGGAALPWKRDLLRAILRAAVRAAGPLPVTMKMRKGIDDEHLTYLEAGRMAEDCGSPRSRCTGARPRRRTRVRRTGRRSPSSRRPSRRCPSSATVTSGRRATRSR
jgi:tRNA-dihydrouridine synthase